MSPWPDLEPLSDAWAQAILASATAAASSGDAATLVQLSAELRRHGLAKAQHTTLQSWTSILTPLMYVAKRRDLVDKMIDELEQHAQKDKQVAQGAQWTAQLSYARARRALLAGHQLESAILYERAVENFDACGDLEHACLHRVGAGFSFNISGAFARAKALLTQAVALAERLAKPHVRANAKSNLAISLARLGHAEEAEHSAREALAYFASVNDTYYRDATSLYLGFIYAHAERWPLVRTTLMPLVGDAVASDIRLCAAAVLSKRALAQEETSDALTHAKLAMALLEQLGDVEEGEEAARLAFIKALLATGDERAASTALRVARARILGKTTDCSDKGLREAFLANADNAEILRLAKETRR